MGSRSSYGRRPKISGWAALIVGLWFVGSVFGDDTDRSGADEAADRPAVQRTQEAERSGGDPAVSPAADTSERPSAKRKNERKRNAGNPPKTRPPAWVVAYVVDGDTIKLANGETVRLVGVDTPERGECGFDKATVALERLVLGKRVSLVRSDEDRDRYGRLLRYVDVDGQDAGLRLIQAGLAVARYDSRDGYGFHPREPRYVAADGAAKSPCSAKAAPKPTPVPLVQPPPGGTGGGACAPGYSPCVPPYPPDVNCADVGGPIRVTGDDPHGLDRDGDGIACES